jgi:hypothetical protein
MGTGSGLTGNASIGMSHLFSAANPHTHTVQFYDDDSFLLDSLTKLIGTTLMAGDVAFVVATPAHREGLAHRLKALGLDLEVSASLGRYCAFDAAETLSGFMVNGALNTTLFHSFLRYILSSLRPTAEGKHTRVVFFGEMVALLWADGNIDAALKLKRLWNDLARTHSFQLHCAYPMKLFAQQSHTQPFLDLCAEKTNIIPTEQYTATSPSCSSKLSPPRPKPPAASASKRPFAVPKSSPPPDASPPASPTRSTTLSKPSPTQSTSPAPAPPKRSPPT